MAYNYYFGNNQTEVVRTNQQDVYEEPNTINPEYVNVNVNNYNYNYINTGGSVPEFIPKRFKKQLQFKKRENVPYNMMKQQVMARYFVIKSVDEDNIHKVNS
jgi:hypothetical protein